MGVLLATWERLAGFCVCRTVHKVACELLVCRKSFFLTHWRVVVVVTSLRMLLNLFLFCAERLVLSSSTKGSSRPSPRGRASLLLIKRSVCSENTESFRLTSVLAAQVIWLPSILFKVWRVSQQLCFPHWTKATCDSWSKRSLYPSLLVFLFVVGLFFSIFCYLLRRAKAAKGLDRVLYRYAYRANPSKTQLPQPAASLFFMPFISLNLLPPLSPFPQPLRDIFVPSHLLVMHGDARLCVHVHLADVRFCRGGCLP